MTTTKAGERPCPRGDAICGRMEMYPLHLTGAKKYRFFIFYVTVFFFLCLIYLLITQNTNLIINSNLVSSSLKVSNT